jgi:hypothetical protein
MDDTTQPQEDRRTLALLAIEAIRKNLSTNRLKECCALCGNAGHLPLIQVEFEGGLHAVCRRCSLSVKKAERWRTGHERLPASGS